MVLGRGQRDSLVSRKNPVIDSLLNSRDFVEIVERQRGGGGDADRYLPGNVSDALDVILGGEERAFAVGRASFVIPHFPPHKLGRLAMSVVPGNNKFLNKVVSIVLYVLVHGT